MDFKLLYEILPHDVEKWSIIDVGEWLKIINRTDLVDTFSNFLLLFLSIFLFNFENQFIYFINKKRNKLDRWCLATQINSLSNGGKTINR